jgi:hypothetical protein
VLTEQPKRTIIYASESLNRVYVIHPDGRILSKLLEDADFVALAKACPDPLLVADSFLPPLLKFPTVVLSSPGRLVHRDLRNRLNDYWPTRYMPLPTEAEVRRMFRVLYDGRADDVHMNDRLILWGPIPRFVLAKNSVDQQALAVDHAMGVPLDEIVAVARGFTSSEYEKAFNNARIKNLSNRDAPHRIVHERAAGQDAEPGSAASDIKSSLYYAPGRCVIASGPFLRYIAQVLEEAQAWHAAFIIDASAGIGPLGSLRGIKFEELALTLLEEGGTFQIRELGDSQAAIAEVKIPKSIPRRIIWDAAAELKGLRDHTQLLVPRVPNNAGLDALVH